MWKQVYVVCLICVLVVAEGLKQENLPYVVQRHKRSPIFLKKAALLGGVVGFGGGLLVGKKLHKDRVIVVHEQPQHFTSDVLGGQFNKIGGLLGGVVPLISNFINRDKGSNEHDKSAAASAAASAASAANAAASAAAASQAAASASATAVAAAAAPHPPVVVPIAVLIPVQKVPTNKLYGSEVTPSGSYQLPYEG